MPHDAVFVVDDEVAVRNGLKFLLRSAGYAVEAFPSAQSFLDTYDPNLGGCLLLDVQMPSMTGLELQQQINQRGWRIPVIFITGHGTIPMTIEAIKAGAFDLIEKPLGEHALLDSIGRALAHSDTAGDERLLRAQLETRAASLTPREREVFELVGAGESCKVIARQLGISFRTVEAHRAHIAEKLRARGTADLIRFASMIRGIGPA
jgi:FixJ family two-component response regulator